ncbi:MAG: hypothetical protein GF344_19460 [Chitinivibrionales bacterium]|nr:hypothetical protein [Chitinivibrionales bacterium]MBD3358804.1 hypothetical protein [Chitinivibrionales bacterium]
MPKFAIAFMVPTGKKPLRHRIVESDDRDAALRDFFNEEVSEYYTADDQGFYYFKDDFFDETSPSGSILTFE